ncbi:MAG: ABC transporter permease [Phycisphaerales bacterium]|nr:ABC transporter permease [Phycisphaerales bacterium]
MLNRVGASILASLHAFGSFVLFSALTARAIVLGMRSWMQWPRFGQQLYFVGSTSVPVVALTGLFIGAILAIEGFDQFASFGLEKRLGGVVNISIVKQIGPVLAAVMLAGRVGCSLAAELGSMRVTDQLDAMRVLAADPIKVLAAPRVVACTVMIPILTIASNLCGVLGGWLIIVLMRGVGNDDYWHFTQAFVGWFDVLNGLTKSIFFGAAIGVIACYKGFTCGRGAQGVGKATTEAFVTSFVAIVLINLVLAKLLNDVDIVRRGGELRSFM